MVFIIILVFETSPKRLKMIQSFSVNLDPVKVKFLNSNTVALAGNSTAGCVQMLYRDGGSTVDDSSLGVLSDIKFASCGKVRDLEVCGVSQENKIILATSHQKTSTNNAKIVLTWTESDIENSTSFQQITLGADCDEISFNSLSCYQMGKTLSSSSESGYVYTWDMISSKQVSKFEADLVGLHRIQYMRTGLLLTIGNSNTSQLRIWDTRYAPTTSSSSSSTHTYPIPPLQNTPTMHSTAQKSFNHPAKSLYGYNRNKDKSKLLVTSCRHPKPVDPADTLVRYTCIYEHPSLPIIYCGTTTGDIVAWDMRNSKMINDKPLSTVRVHENNITSILSHPENDALLFSSSQDGTLRETLYDKLVNITSNTSTSNTMQVQVYPNSYTSPYISTYSHDDALSNCSSIVLNEPFPSMITSMDIHMSERILISTSTTGCIYQIQLD